MKITYLKLEKFKRFPLSDIEIFEHHFTNKLIAIIGSNGSGKSSLLRELSPLPSSKENFYTNGCKEIHIEHNRNTYILTSSFKDGTSYSFLLNDEELNNSGLISIQKELVEKHFSLTEEIFDILIGQTNFTTLSSIQRKKLFSNICHINIDELLSLHEAKKEDIKVQETILKNQLTTFNVEKEKLLNRENYETLRTQQNLYSSYALLLSDTLHGLKSYKSSETLDSSYTLLNSLRIKVNSLYKNNYTLLTSYGINDYNELFNIFTKKRVTLDHSLAEKYKALEKLLTELDNVDIVKNNNLDTVKLNIETLDKQIYELTSSLTLITDTDINVTDYQNALYKAETQILSFLYDIETNENRVYTKEKHSNMLQEKQNLLYELSKILENIAIVTKEIEHTSSLVSSVSLNCPSCNFEFSPNFNVNVIQSLQSKLNDLQSRKEVVTSSLETLNKSIEKSTIYFNHINNFINITKQLPLLVNVWNYIQKNSSLFIDPKSISTTLKNALQDVNNIFNIQTLTLKLKSLEATLNVLQSTSLTSKLEIRKSIDEIESDISFLQTEKVDIEIKLNMLQTVKNIHSYLTKLLTMLSNASTSVFTVNQQYVATELSSELLNEIARVKLLLLDIDTTILQYEKTSSLLEHYKNDIATTEETIFLLNAILTELSPKNGLIARIISNYLNVIIKYMNSYINNVMEYKVEIELLNMETSVLDYKFKFNVENKLTVTDISKASSGMKEIIDLSFKLVFYKLLKLENFPLYLDEFGVRLDSSHKAKIHSLIFKFLNSSNFSSIFLVTHIDTGFLEHKEAEVISL